MLASELLDLFEAYEEYHYTPSDESVIFGCDCGCGGNLYTSEEWDMAHKKAFEVIKALKDAFESLGIEWDLDKDEEV
jgi:hypothetical protein